MKIFKKMVIYFIIILLICLTICSIYNYTYATSQSGVIKSTFKGGSGGSLGTTKQTATNIISTILDVVRLVGAAVAVIILIVIACKYIIASAGDRADIKKYAINYVIGAIILFATTGILSLIKQFIKDSLG